MKQRARTTDRIAAGLWFLGSVGILVLAAVALFTLPLPSNFERSTPFDYTPMSDPQAWYFLQKAEACLEPGATIVPIAATPQQEHELYVLAVAALDRNRPLAASYFGWTHPDNIEAARYILVYRETPRDLSKFREVCSVTFGKVYERGAGR